MKTKVIMIVSLMSAGAWAQLTTYPMCASGTMGCPGFSGDMNSSMGTPGTNTGQNAQNNLQPYGSNYPNQGTNQQPGIAGGTNQSLTPNTPNTSTITGDTSSAGTNGAAGIAGGANQATNPTTGRTVGGPNPGPGTNTMGSPGTAGTYGGIGAYTPKGP
ncbi:MAG: hypothetical protein P4M08_15535 [Oligoflexia bacterium]|nr:hypothetical protein [Oligoflexia bacterium]